MPAAPALDPRLLTLLESVSRSFYLSIRLLPAGLRHPVGVGYLLARASDTLADAPGLPAGKRLELLDRFMASVRTGEPTGMTEGAAVGTPGERQLLASLPECFSLLRALAPADREDIVTVLTHITRGQRLDIERFGDASAAQPRALASAADLDEYTYLVAGSVGEFWTRLGSRHVPDFANLPAQEMMALGKRYGMALQLVNVLRDEVDDFAIGRRYLPDANRHAWLLRAHDGLRCGIRYCLALEGRRLRIASALPALIGARTLTMIDAAGVRASGERVKVPRSEVHGLLARLAFSLAGRARIQREFDMALVDNRPR